MLFRSIVLKKVKINSLTEANILQMIQLLTIIGARPQIIKAAALSRAIHRHFADRICEKILHTGQHYDENMSGVFFSELNIPKPDFNLNVGSGTHGEQTAKMITGIENVLMNGEFDGVVVYGDTNSTLAGAVAASKLHIPLIHIEAGLRSYNMTMPEEINRIACDHLSSLLFAPTKTGMENLRIEGFFETKAQFANGKKREIYNCGDIMYDNSLYFAALSESKREIFERFSIDAGNYVLATIHRDTNTDNPERLNGIFEAIIAIADENNVQMVIPLHPRTLKLLKQNVSTEIYARLTEQSESLYANTDNRSSIKIIPPASFLEMTLLEKNAKLIMTDSGGVQKEAYYFKKPCIILRPETEWVEIVEQGAGVITDASFHRIVEAYRTLSAVECNFVPLFGNGNTSETILEKICNYFN